MGVKKPLLISSLLLVIVRVFFYPFLPLYVVLLPALLFTSTILLRAPDAVVASWDEERIVAIRKSEFELSLSVEVRRGVGVCSVSLNLPEELEVVGGTPRATFFKWPWPRRVKIGVRLRPKRMGDYTIQSPEFSAFGVLMSEFRTFHVGDPLRIVVLPEGGEGRSRAREIRSVLVKVPMAHGAPVGSLSMEFREIREYRSDPMKLINWKATARTGKLLVNEYEREGGGTVVIYVDNRGAVLEETAFMISLLFKQLSGVGYDVIVYPIGSGRKLPPSLDQKTIYRLLLNHPTREEGFREALRKTMNELSGWNPTTIVVTSSMEENFEELSWFIGKLRRLLPHKRPIVVDARLGGIGMLKDARRDRELNVPVLLWSVYRDSPIRVASMIGLRIGRERR